MLDTDPMIVAFHFQVDEAQHRGNYAHALQDTFFGCLSGAKSRDVHLQIWTGDLLVSEHLANEAARENILRALLGYDPRRWKTLSGDEFADALFSATIYVVAAEGLIRSVGEYLDHQLRRHSSYLGCLEIDPANRVHWVLYTQKLIPRYRYLDGEIRLFYREFEEREGADTKDLGRAADLERQGFRVAWEDIGLRHTIFDSYQSFEHAARLADLQTYLSEHLARVADEILLRAATLDPRLNDVLHAALSGFERIQTREEIAQVALSCRGFLQGLADALYPPRTEPVEGRGLGPNEYRNRLWAYVKGNLQGDQQRLLLAQLEDLGNRVDRVDHLANKGLHAQITQPDIRRLIAALLVLAYDLLTLCPPPSQSSFEPYSDGIQDFVRWVAKRGPGSAGKEEGEDR